jgi:hypothetical protein
MGASHLPHMARRPAIFPSRYRSKFELVIKLKIAKALGIDCLRHHWRLPTR